MVAALCLVSVEPVKAQRSMLDRIEWLDFMSPYKERFKVAFLNNREAKAVQEELGGVNIADTYDVVPKLRGTYLLDNGWILHNQYVDGNFLLYQDRAVFEQIIRLGFMHGIGIRFRRGGFNTIPTRSTTRRSSTGSVLQAGGRRCPP